jgi:hypothetical protein
MSNAATKALATQLAHLMNKVNLAGIDNDLPHAFSRDASVFGKLADALQMVDADMCDTYFKYGDLPNLIEIDAEVE